MSRPVARTLGALALAAAVATSSTAALAATMPGDPAIYAIKKWATTLVGLSRELRTSAVQKARSRPTALRLTAERGSSQSAPTDKDLDETCFGDWFIYWDEDENGNGIVGTYNLYCDGSVIPIG